jgi:hypothetical protein
MQKSTETSARARYQGAPESSGLLENSYISSFNISSPPRNRIAPAGGGPANLVSARPSFEVEHPPPFRRTPNGLAISRISTLPPGARKRTKLFFAFPPCASVAPDGRTSGQLLDLVIRQYANRGRQDRHDRRHKFTTIQSLQSARHLFASPRA